MRNASLPDERLSTMHKTYRPVGRPKKRWEDEINENDFLKPEENEETKGKRNNKLRHLDKSGKNSESNGKPNTQRQQPQHPLTVYTADEILHKVQFDHHAT